MTSEKRGVTPRFYLRSRALKVGVQSNCTVGLKSDFHGARSLPAARQDAGGKIAGYFLHGVME
jgi:hypothetical protein